MHKYPLIRTIYLYLFSLVGLVLMIIAAVSFIDMALKAFVFTQAEADQRLANKEPPYPVFGPERTKIIAQTKEGESVTLTADEHAQLSQWLSQYQAQEEERKNIDYVTVRRQQEAAHSIAMLLVGIPLYLYHWSVIKKEAKERKEA